MYLILDTETGGLDPQNNSLLTLYMAIYDENFNYVNELDLLLKPNDGIYKVCGDAMKINKISLTQHDEKAITYSQASVKILAFFAKYISYKRLTVIGHNVKFDIDFICTHVVSKTPWNVYVDYHVLDTSILGNFYIKMGLLPFTLKLSLASLCDYFKITNNSQHNAKSDAFATFEVYKKLCQLQKNNYMQYNK